MFTIAARRQLGLYVPSMWPSLQSESTRCQQVAAEAGPAEASAGTETTARTSGTRRLRDRSDNAIPPTNECLREEGSRRRWAGGGRGGGSQWEAERRGRQPLTRADSNRPRHRGRMSAEPKTAVRRP